MIPERIMFTDRTVGRRCIVTIDGKDVTLTYKSFTYLLRLAWARRQSPDGWIHRFALEPGYNQTRYLYRLKREEVQRQAGIDWEIFERDTACNRVRLLVDPKGIIVSGGLRHFDDAEISQMAADLA